MNCLKDIKQEIIILSEEMEKKQKKIKKLIKKFLKKKAINFISLNLSENEDAYWKTIKSFCFSQSIEKEDKYPRYDFEYESDGAKEV